MVAPTYSFEGHIDFYGYHSQAQGWFVGGWITYPWPAAYRPTHSRAMFHDGSRIERTSSIFYQRDDVNGRGIGFVFFLGPDPTSGRILRSMNVLSGKVTYTIYPTPTALVLDEAQLAAHLQPIMAAGHDDEQRRWMQDILSTTSTMPVVRGFVDYYGYHAAAGGWLFCGWIDAALPETELARMVASFQEGDLEGEFFKAQFPREDLESGAEGIVIFARGSSALLGGLCCVSLEGDLCRAILQCAPTTARLREHELVGRVRPLLGQSAATRHRDALLELLGRRPYTGEDTLSGISTPVHLEIDEAIICGADGLALMGWCLARPGELKEIRLRSGPLSTAVDLKSGIRISRPDVIEGFAPQGFDDPNCGFVVFLPKAVMSGERMYFEVETKRRECGYRNVPTPKLNGMAAIKRLLEAVDVRFTDVEAAFDRVLGPAVEGLNQRRLSARPSAEIMDYGSVPELPRYSVIVPLYGRLDFVEYQMALFSIHSGNEDIEYIYVLDDPPKRRQAQVLFASVYERFLVPFRAIFLDRNQGFAPANNIGLQHARGVYVAYLNSDVFPGAPDWLDRLAQRLENDVSLGAVGPTLLFEDGSVQHRGMHFERLPEFGNWHFGMHQGKGLRAPSHDGSVQHWLSITGACILMRRALAENLGGFDEVYAIGDFEDSDLCMKILGKGLLCGVDPDVQLFHLERKSQVGSALGWRMNLTLYNAWQHERRWGKVIAEHQKA